MVRTASDMLPLGTAAPDFRLKDVVRDCNVSLADCAADRPLLVMFVCNHCPYVVHVRDEFPRLAKDYEGRITIVAINANSLATHPHDGPGPMRELAVAEGWTFPFLFDATQETAKAYHAACTPDFFLFRVAASDGARRLSYRGQLDDARPGNAVMVTGSDLRAAIDALLAGGEPSADQRASLGCNIKWAPDNEPEYFPVTG